MYTILIEPRCFEENILYVFKRKSDQTSFHVDNMEWENILYWHSDFFFITFSLLEYLNLHNCRA